MRPLPDENYRNWEWEWVLACGDKTVMSVLYKPDLIKATHKNGNILRICHFFTQEYALYKMNGEFIYRIKTDIDLTHGKCLLEYLLSAAVNGWGESRERATMDFNHFWKEEVEWVEIPLEG